MDTIALRTAPAVPAPTERARGKILLNPRYRAPLERLGLTEAGHFLALPGVVVSGHPDRNVARVELGSGPSAVRAYLKCEHRRSRKQECLNAWAGFGRVSRSRREAEVLQAAARAGIGCPEFIAAGEDENGRAFLLVREVSGTVELRRFLAGRSGRERRAFARQLGEALARLHRAGLQHPDLCSKHVLVNPADGTIHFLDWQRARAFRRLGWRRCLRDLSALDATLSPDLASPWERLICLVAYLRQGGCPGITPPRAIRAITRRSRHVRAGSRARELLQPFAGESPSLLRLDGEALCVTPEFQAALAGRLPGWLAGPGNGVEPARVNVPGVAGALLTRRRESRQLRWIWACLRGRGLRTPEVDQAGLLLRLQRLGIPGPRLLAFGRRFCRPWHTESFLLVEDAPGASLAGWLADRSRGCPSQRWHVLRGAGALFRRLHDSGCSLDHPRPPLDGLLRVRTSETGGAVVLGSITGLRKQGRLPARHARRDLAAVRDYLRSRSGWSRTDELRFVLAYLGVERLTLAATRLLRHSARGER